MKRYRAIELISTDLTGGSTRPWKVRAIDDNESLVDIALKLYTEKDIEQYQPVAKEIYGNFLARELGLKAPECGLVDIDADFADSLPQEYIQRLNQVHSGLKFGSEWVDNSLLLDVEHIEKAPDEYEIALVYAFDHLVLNLDRKPAKPNLLITATHLWLIDHEMCFPYENDVYLSEFVNTGRWPYQSSNHLPYPGLIKDKYRNKPTLFDEFSEYLKRLDLNKLDQIRVFLVANGVMPCDHSLILSHIRTLQTDSARFITFLNESLR